MRIWKSWAANTLWQFSCYPAWRRFDRAVEHAARIQEARLFHYLRANQDTEYGKQHGFSNINSIIDFQNKVPLTTFDDYQLAVEQMGLGKQNVLTTSHLRLFELSSGSTSASKRVPYTDQLQVEFQAGISPWIYSLFQYHPELKQGMAYWSISPLTQGKQFTSAGIPIGFEEDSAYLGRTSKLLVNSVMSVPNEVKNLQDIETFRYITLFFLLKNKNLRLVSVWNPTFLLLLLAPLKNWWPLLLSDIDQGIVHPPGELQPAIQTRLQEYVSPDANRSSELARLSPEDYSHIWPEFRFLSCWMDGPSMAFANDLMKLFPSVIFQGKGLIATEAFVSFPLPGLPGSVLSINSHFFEFLPETDNGRPLLAHELEHGQRYSVIVTTGGGLYRYQLQDIIEVCGHYKQVPLIQFMYKSDHISDWFGEKLAEGFVAQQLSILFKQHQLTPKFYLLAPDNRNESFRYTLFLELDPAQHKTLARKKIVKALDYALRQNFHYNYCRQLCQIGEPDIILIPGNGSERYLQEKQERGQKLGNIKSTVIENTLGWHKVFIENATMKLS